MQWWMSDEHESDDNNEIFIMTEPLTLRNKEEKALHHTHTHTHTHTHVHTHTRTHTHTHTHTRTSGIALTHVLCVFNAVLNTNVYAFFLLLFIYIYIKKKLRS